MSAKSWPAENTGPAPASTTPRASEAPTCSNAASSDRSISSDRALRRCGRFIVMVAKSPARRMTTSGSLMHTIVLEPAHPPLTDGPQHHLALLIRLIGQAAACRPARQSVLSYGGNRRAARLNPWSPASRRPRPAWAAAHGSGLARPRAPPGRRHPRARPGQVPARPADAPAALSASSARWRRRPHHPVTTPAGRSTAGPPSVGPVHLPNELALQRPLKVSRQTPEPVGQGSSPWSAYWWLSNGPKLAITLRPDHRRVQDEVRLHLAELRAAGTSEADLLRAQELYAGLTTERLDDERLWAVLFRVCGRLGDQLGLDVSVRHLARRWSSWASATT